jgi:MFS superfamily sulfate permease-like transporter
MRLTTKGRFAVTAMGVVTIGVLRALIVAVVLSILDVVRRSARPHDAVLGWVDRLGRWANVSLHPSARLTEGVVVYRLDDRLFFANADYVKGRVHEAVRGAPYPVEWLVFDADAVSNVDVTGAEALEDLAQKLRREGIGLAVACMRPYVYEVLEDAGVVGVDVIGEGRFFPTVRSAVAWCSEHDPAESRVIST